MDKTLSSLLALLSSFTWLVYWTGRWYKEWYFKNFLINYASLDFDYFFYMHASWATIAVAISCLIIIAHFLMALVIKNNWYWKLYPAILCLLSLCIVTFWPFHFNSNGSFPEKLLGSNDLCLIVTGIAAAVGIGFFIFSHINAIRPVYRSITAFVKNHIILSLLTVFAVSWVYLAIAGYFMGNYHGQSAIWEGKIGVNWVKAKEKWWIFVVRSNDGRNFLFDRENTLTIIVSDNEISQINGNVTRLAKK